MPPALAVNVAACAVVTDETEAVNAALVALAATVTVAGTLTAALLLDRLTLNPPLGATALSDTVQASLPAPVMDVLLHEIALNPAVVDGVPVPLRLTPTVGLVQLLLLVIVNCPAAAPVVPGANRTVSVAVFPALIVNGKVSPDIVKPVPVTVGAYTVTGRLPVDDKITDWVAAAFAATFPKAKLLWATLNICVSESNCRARLFETVPWLAISVTAWLTPAHCEVTVKAALVAFAGTATEAGTVTDELLLERLTLSPPLGAAAFSVTAQASVPCPAKDALLQVNPLNAGVALADTASGKQKENIKKTLICQELSRHIPACLRAVCRLRCELGLVEMVLVVASS